MGTSFLGKAYMPEYLVFCFQKEGTCIISPPLSLHLVREILIRAADILECTSGIRG